MLTNPTVSLAKATQTESASSLTAAASAQHIVVEGRMLVTRTAFVGHSFLPEDQQIVSYIKELLGEMQFKCSSGEKAEAGPIHDKVKRRILAADFFVGIFTRRDKIEGKELWSTTEWVVEELSYAAANDKKVIILREDNLVNFGGMQGNLEYIGFNRDQLHLASIKLLQVLWSLNPGKFSFNTNRPPQMSLDVLRAAAEASPREPLLRVALADAFRQNGLIKAAIDELDGVLREFPDLSAALLGKIECLRVCGQRKQAKELAEQLLSAYPSFADGHHRLGHILAEMHDYTAAEQEFALAADCQPTEPKHLKCLAELLIRTGSQRRAKLEKALQLCEEIRHIGGEKWESKASTLIDAIKVRIRRLPKQQSTPKPPKRRGRRNIH